MPQGYTKLVQMSATSRRAWYRLTSYYTDPKRSWIDLNLFFHVSVCQMLFPYIQPTGHYFWDIVRKFGTLTCLIQKRMVLKMIRIEPVFRPFPMQSPKSSQIIQNTNLQIGRNLPKKCPTFEHHRVSTSALIAHCIKIQVEFFRTQMETIKLHLSLKFDLN